MASWVEIKCNYTCHERDEDARLIITIKTLKKTNLGMVQVLFHYVPICFWLKILAFLCGRARGRTSWSPVVNKELMGSYLTLHLFVVDCCNLFVDAVICDPEMNKICSYVLTNQKYSQNQSLFNTGTQMHFTAVAPYTVIILFVIHPTVITIA